MKRIAVIFLTCCLLFCFAACSSVPTGTLPTASENTGASLPAGPESFTPGESDGFPSDELLGAESVGTIEDILSGLTSRTESASSSGTSSVGTSSAGNSSSGNQNQSTPVLHQETKAIWISYLELNDLLKGKSKAEFLKNLGKAYDNVKSLGLNTVIVQVRPYADALYPSDYFPWSAYGSGTVGKAPAFDPLDCMVDLAHEKGLSFHAWINPMRGMTQEETELVPNTYQTRKWHDQRTDSDRLVYKGTRWYLNPAYPEVRKLIADGAAEIVKKYPVDAIHIDDYFYPTTDSSFDKIAYEKYGGGKNLTQFRLDNATQMVKELYQAVKRANPKVLFGVSPQGNVDNNYNSQYADVKLWCSKAGYLDYIAPQVYFGFENSGQPYLKTIQQWNEMVKADGIQLMIGLACHKIGMAEDSYAGEGKAEWSKSTDIIKRQIEEAKKLSKYRGIALFDYKSLFDCKTGLPLAKEAVQKEIENMKPVLQ